MSPSWCIEFDKGRSDPIIYMRHHLCEDIEFLYCLGAEGSFSMWNAKDGSIDSTVELSFVSIDASNGEVMRYNLRKTFFSSCITAQYNAESPFFIYAGTACGHVGEFSSEYGQLIREFSGHSGPITSIQLISTTGTQATHLLTASRDKTLRVWDLETGNCVTVVSFESSVLCTDVYPQSHPVEEEVVVELMPLSDSDRSTMNFVNGQTIKAHTQVDKWTNATQLVAVGCQDGTFRIVDCKTWNTSSIVTPDKSMNADVLPVHAMEAGAEVPMSLKKPPIDSPPAQPICVVQIFDMFVSEKQKEKDSKPPVLKDLNPQNVDMLNKAMETLSLIDAGLFVRFGTTSGDFGVYKIRTGKLVYMRSLGFDSISSIVSVPMVWDELIDIPNHEFLPLMYQKYLLALKSSENDDKTDKKKSGGASGKKSAKKSKSGLARPEGFYRALVVGFDGFMEIVDMETPNKVYLRLCEGRNSISNNDQSAFSIRSFVNSAKIFNSGNVTSAALSGGEIAPTCAWTCIFADGLIFVGGADGIVRGYELKECATRKVENDAMTSEDFYSAVREKDCDPGIYAAIEKAKKAKEKGKAKKKPKSKSKSS